MRVTKNSVMDLKRQKAPQQAQLIGTPQFLVNEDGDQLAEDGDNWHSWEQRGHLVLDAFEEMEAWTNL